MKAQREEIKRQRETVLVGDEGTRGKNLETGKRKKRVNSRADTKKGRSEPIYRTSEIEITRFLRKNTATPNQTQPVNSSDNAVR